MEAKASNPWRPKRAVGGTLAAAGKASVGGGDNGVAGLSAALGSSSSSSSLNHPISTTAESPSASTKTSVGYDSDRTSTPESTSVQRHHHHHSDQHSCGETISSRSRNVDVEEDDDSGGGGGCGESQRDNGNDCTGASTDVDFGQKIRNGLASDRLMMQLHDDSCGGTYWICEAIKGGVPVAVFKPADEEIGQEGNPHGNTESDRDDVFVPGTGYKREILAYLLDHEHSAGVPQTVEVSIGGKTGSLQRFALHGTEAGNHLPGKFSRDDVHRIAILDLRTLNNDRHGGNILVQAPRQNLIPIDHSYIAPSGYADPDFEWMTWPQATVPFSQAIRDYVGRLDPRRDHDLVRDLLDDDDASEIVLIATTAVKIAVAGGYVAREIAQFFRRETLTQPSRLEVLLGECRRPLDQGGTVDLDKFTRLLIQSFPPHEER